VLPYESLSSHASIDTKIKEKKKKRILNIDLAVLPSHDTTSIYTASGIMNADLLRVRRLGLVGYLEKNTEYTQNSI